MRIARRNLTKMSFVNVQMTMQTTRTVPTAITTTGRD